MLINSKQNTLTNNSTKDFALTQLLNQYETANTGDNIDIAKESLEELKDITGVPIPDPEKNRDL